MTWLITGGAGYISSHVVNQFLSAGKKVFIFDSLINGLKSRVDFINSLHPENQAIGGAVDLVDRLTCPTVWLPVLCEDQAGIDGLS
jgi:UDP-glucose 4-epimerase